MYNFRPNGELYLRASKNFGRLHDGIYHCWKVPHCDLSWPGDYEGRVLLGLISQSQVNGIAPVYLKELTECMFERSAEFGYFGDEFDSEKINEQQLSGNSWFLRSMVELYRYNGDERALDRVRRGIGNLFLPCLGLYNEYPLERNTSKSGKESGELDNLNGRWLCSTDIGCAYIPLDGVTSCYELLSYMGDECEKLEALIEEMIENYFKLDFLGMKVQTHATLSGLRGILRYASLTFKPELIDKVKKVFDLYLSDGMTENYENKNWFRRPEWTEPCAIIDSFAVASQLFGATGDSFYMNIAQKIYFNGISTSQRANGGFGTDKCVGEDSRDTIAIGCKEATWCCTMRGGEGFKYVITTAVEEKSDAAYVNIPASGKFESKYGSFEIRTNYPYEGKIEIISNDYLLPVCVFIPDYAQKVTVNGRDVQVVDGFVPVFGSGTVEFDIPLVSDKNVYLHGNLVLCGKEKICGEYHLSDGAQAIYSNGESEIFPVREAFFPWDDISERVYYVMKGSN